jgi:hypothetical protein
MLDSPDPRHEASLYANLSIDLIQMKFNRFFTDAKFTSDCFVRFSGNDSLQNLYFTRSETSQALPFAALTFASRFQGVYRRYIHCSISVHVANRERACTLGHGFDPEIPPLNKHFRSSCHRRDRWDCRNIRAFRRLSLLSPNLIGGLSRLVTPGWLDQDGQP